MFYVAEMDPNFPSYDAYPGDMHMDRMEGVMMPDEFNIPYDRTDHY